MFGKIFDQIYDSSIAEDWTVRMVFQDFIVLADINGVVNRTHEAIARRTNVPIDIVRKAITVLESPDSQSQSPVADGKRIVRLDEHRDWGWQIVNYKAYRDIASDEQRREKTLARVRKFRNDNSLGPCNDDVTHVTLCNAGNAMQKQKQREKQKQRDSALFPECETPSWEEFWTYCQMGHGPMAEFYARDKFQAAEQNRWEKQRNWRAYATRCRTWWENDGSPMKPKGNPGEPEEIVLTSKAQLDEALRKDAAECERLRKEMLKQPPFGVK